MFFWWGSENMDKKSKSTKKRVVRDKGSNHSADRFLLRDDGKKDTGRRSIIASWFLKDDNKKMLQGWLRSGLTNEQIAAKLGVTATTFYNFQKKCTEFDVFIHDNKLSFDIEVENALLKRALGYRYEEIVIEEVLDKFGEIRELKKVVQKHMPADTTAGIFWLKNRRAKRWRDKQEIVIDDKTGITKTLKEARERATMRTIDVVDVGSGGDDSGQR